MALFQPLEQIDDKVAHGGLDGKADAFKRRPPSHRLRYDREPQGGACGVGVGPLREGLEDVLALRLCQRPAEEAQEVLQHSFWLADGLDLNHLALVVASVEPGLQNGHALELAGIVWQRRHHDTHVGRQACCWQPVEPAPAVGVVELVQRVDEELERRIVGGPHRDCGVEVVSERL